MNELRNALVAAAITAIGACGAGDVATVDETTADAGAATVSSHASVDVRWAPSWEAALERARNERKPVLVVFSADWCVWCKRLETTTFGDPEAAGLLADAVVPVKLDVDGDGRALSDEYGVDPLPTMVVLASDGVELGRIVGYVPPGAFLERMRAILPAG